MSYLVLARKYRPRTFAEVAGQPAIAKTLENAIGLGRIAHAYLFAGPRGVGKTSLARILARSLCCEKGPSTSPCDSCDRCIDILKGNDLDVVEIDGASNRGIDDIRSLRDRARVAPMRGSSKLYIIDEVQQLTQDAFNALLKILEEPPEHVLFVLATTEPERIPDTIRSRCQFFEFRRVSEQEIKDRLVLVCGEEKVAAEEEALVEIARLARGGMRDALSLLDQSITYGGGEVTRQGVLEITGGLSRTLVRELMAASLGGDVTVLLDQLNQLDQKGVAPEGIVDALLELSRDLMVVCASGGQTDLVVVDDELRGLVGSMDLDGALAVVNLLLQARRRVREHDDPRLPLEAALLRITRLSETMPLSDALSRLRDGGTLPASGRSGESPRSAGPTSAAGAPPASNRGPASGSAPTGKKGRNQEGGEAPSSSQPIATQAGESASLLLQRITEDTLTRHGSVSHYLAGFEALGISGDVVKVRREDDRKSLYTLKDSKVRKILDETTERLFGRVLEFQEEAAERSAPETSSAPKERGASPPAKKVTKKPGNGQALDRAREMFDGEVI